MKADERRILWLTKKYTNIYNGRRLGKLSLNSLFLPEKNLFRLNKKGKYLPLLQKFISYTATQFRFQFYKTLQEDLTKMSHRKLPIISIFLLDFSYLSLPDMNIRLSALWKWNSLSPCSLSQSATDNPIFIFPWPKVIYIFHPNNWF